MVHAEVIIPKNKLNALVRELHERGICEVIKDSEKTETTEIVLEINSEAEELGNELQSLIEKIKPYKEILKPESLVKSIFFPQKPVKLKANPLSDKEVLAEVRSNLEKIVPRIDPLLSEIMKIEKDLTDLDYKKSMLFSLPDVSLDALSSTERIKIIVGLIKNEVLEKNNEYLKENTVTVALESTPEKMLIISAVETEKAESVLKELHLIGFEELVVPDENRRPAEIIEEINKNEHVLEIKKNEMIRALREVSKLYYKKMSLLGQELGFVIERLDALRHDSGGESYSVLKAWVPGKHESEFKSLVKVTAGECYGEFEEKMDAPTILQNNRFLKPFEVITGLYSYPKYKEVDPTPVLGITFAFFFGFMLTDFFYGFILSMIAFMISRGIGRYDEGMRQVSVMLAIMGAFTAVLGIVFGSYFGDFFQRIGIGLPMLVDPLSQIIVVIGIGLGIGVVHMGTALTIGFVENIRKGKKKEAFHRHGVWLFFLSGLIVATAGFLPIGIGLIGISFVMQFVFNFLESGTVIAALSLFNFSGFIGDMFSYTRLTALAIGTAGIALAINFMSLMVIDMIPYVGIVVAVIVFGVGHMFNMVMNGFGGFIHTLRLHFLEFFQKFYEGGGRAYIPFSVQRKVNWR